MLAQGRGLHLEVEPEHDQRDDQRDDGGRAPLVHDYNASSPLYQDEVGGDDESWARDDFDDDEHNAVYDDDGYARRRYGGGDEGEEGDDERWGAVRVSAADVERYDDATTLLGDVSVTTDVHSVRQCHELCVSEPACAAWTLDKYRYVCLLRLLNVSTVRYSADYIGGRLDAFELATRAADWGDADADVEAAAAAREAEGEEAGGNGLKFVAQARRAVRRRAVGASFRAARRIGRPRRRRPARRRLQVGQRRRLGRWLRRRVRRGAGVRGVDALEDAAALLAQVDELHAHRSEPIQGPRLRPARAAAA